MGLSTCSGSRGHGVPLPDWLNGYLSPGIQFPSTDSASSAPLAVALPLPAGQPYAFGMRIRAGASNRTMIGALGVNIKLLFALVFGLGRHAGRPRRPDGGADLPIR